MSKPKKPCARCAHPHDRHGPSGCVDCEPFTAKDCLRYVNPDCETCGGSGSYFTGAFVEVNYALAPINSACPDCDGWP